MRTNKFTIKITGMAGMGIKSGGLLVSEFLASYGLNFLDYSEYPSLVRGGHNTYQASFGYEKVNSADYKVDLFFGLEKGHTKNHIDEFDKNSLIFCQDNINGIKTIYFPFDELVVKTGFVMGRNIAVLAVVCSVFELSTNRAIELIKSTYSSGQEKNIEVFNLAFEYSKKLGLKNIWIKIDKTRKSNVYINDGNQAAAWGFLKAGGNFFAAYPMTPATGILHFLAKKQKDFDLIVVHPEDEIAVASMATGAAFAGMKSAVATSGGGFALMTETLSFNGIGEIGVVYFLVSRPGPATGLPTWTGQGDILFATFAGHGEFPKIVLSPGDHQEAFELSACAIDLAYNFQLPVIFLSDKALAESSSNTRDFGKAKIIKIPKQWQYPEKSNNFKRYDLGFKSGVSPVSLPGDTDGEYLCNSYEHDEYGFSTEDSETIRQMTNKRWRKMTSLVKYVPEPILFKSEKRTKNLVISFGSNKGAILDCQGECRNFDYLHLKTLWPLMLSVGKIIDKYEKIWLIENDKKIGLEVLLKSTFDIKISKTLGKYDGRPFFSQELISYFRKI